MFSLTNDTPKPAPRKFDSLQASQRKPDAGPDMPPESIGGAYWIRFDNTAQGPYSTKLEAVAAYRGMRQFHTQENNR